MHRFVPSKLAHIHEVPKESLNWRLLLAVLTMGLLGASRGMDEGLIAGSIGTPAFEHAFNVKKKSEKESNIVAMVQLLSTFGAFVGYFASDKLGRVRAAQLSCVLVFIGCGFWLGAAHRVALLYLGRAIIGTGIGMMSVCSPVFLVETSPRQIRGLCTSIYSVSIYLGSLLGYATNLGASRTFSKNSNTIWRIVIILPYAWHFAIFVGTFFIHESPRWLMKQGRTQDAARSLEFYRKLTPSRREFIEEFEVMQQSVEEDNKATAGLRFSDRVKHLFTSRKNLMKIGLGAMIQLLVQWGGPGAIATYANRIMTLIGASDKNGYVMSVGFGATKFAAGMLSLFFLIDLVGRRKTLFAGVFIQGISMLYVAIFLGLYVDGDRTAGETAAGKAALVAIFFSGAAFSAGGNLAQYLVGTEIFDVQVRSMGSAVVMMLHYLLQYSCTRSLQPMLNSSMGGAGTFALFAGVCLVLSLPFYALFLPETAGMPLEEIDQVFELPWYKIGRARPAHMANKQAEPAGLPELGLDSSSGQSAQSTNDDIKK